MKTMKSLIVAAAVLGQGIAFAGGDGWVTDFEAAKAEAEKSGKDLLVDFTGSDWCGWCVKLNKEVFQHDEFKNGVKDTFVLVELDFPRKKEIDPELKKQNKALAEEYAVRGYPTILLCDASGRPYAKTGYRKGGPEAYVAHLNEFRETRIARDKALSAAEKAEGVEKAKALVQALESIQVSDDLVTQFYGGLVEQIKAADPNDESGYLSKLALNGKIEAAYKEINQLARGGKMDEALGVMDGLLAEKGLTLAQKQQFMMTKAQIYTNTKQLDSALNQIDEALKVDPEGPYNEGIKKFRAQVEGIKAKADADAAPKESDPKG